MDLGSPDEELGDAGVVALAYALHCNVLPSLKQLFLTGNKIGDDGAGALSAALSQGAVPQLELLGLRNNEIGDLGMAALSDAFTEKNNGTLQSLTHLYLDDNAAPVDCEGLKALAGALESGALPKLMVLTADVLLDDNNEVVDEAPLLVAANKRGIDLEV